MVVVSGHPEIALQNGIFVTTKEPAMTRVAFTFDEQSFRSLKRVTANGGFTSMGTALRESVELSRILQEEAKNGFSELLVSNGRQENQILVPSIERMLRKRL